MALRNIVTEPDELLGKTSRRVVDFNKRLGQLLDDMKDTMYNMNGLGIAAVQVGILRRAIVINVEDEHGLVELINPEIIKTEGTQDGREGCLSFPRKFGEVIRPLTVTVKAQDRNGDWHEYTGSDMFARCVCHEVDHLDGKVFIDIARNIEIVSGEEYRDYESEEEKGW